MLTPSSDRDQRRPRGNEPFCTHIPALDPAAQRGPPPRPGPLVETGQACGRWARARFVGLRGVGKGDGVGGAGVGWVGSSREAAAGDAVPTSRTFVLVHMWWGRPPESCPGIPGATPDIPRKAVLSGLRACVGEGAGQAFPAAVQLWTRWPDVGAGRSAGAWGCPPPHLSRRREGWGGGCRWAGQAERGGGLGPGP